MKKLIIVTLFAILAIGIAAQSLPSELWIFQPMRKVEPILKKQGYVFKSKGEYSREYTNDKIEHLVSLVLIVNSADEMTDWTLNYYSKEPDKLYQQLTEMLTKAYGKVSDTIKNKLIWDVDLDLIAVLEKLDNEKVNVRISFEYFYDLYGD